MSSKDRKTHFLVYSSEYIAELVGHQLNHQFQESNIHPAHNLDQVVLVLKKQVPRNKPLMVVLDGSTPDANAAINLLRSGTLAYTLLSLTPPDISGAPGYPRKDLLKGDEFSKFVNDSKPQKHRPRS